MDLCLIGKQNKETDTGTQCFLNDDDLTGKRE